MTTLVEGSWEMEGFYLRMQSDEGEVVACITSLDVARALLEAVQPLREWVDEADRELAAFRRATPEERRAVLYREQEEDQAETLRAHADWSRKAEKENR